MQGLIHIGLRHGDIILETSRNRLVHFMNDTECRITVLHGIYNNTHGKNVVNLVECLILVDHLSVNGEEVLDTSVNLCFNARIADVHADFFDNAVDKCFSACFI